MSTPEQFTAQLTQLASLHDAGVLDDDEFAAAKARVLAYETGQPAPADGDADDPPPPVLAAVPPPPAELTTTTTTAAVEGGNAGLAVDPGTPVQPPDEAAAAAPAGEPGPNTVTVPAHELPVDHPGYNPDPAAPAVEVQTDPGPIRVTQPCPTCGRNETAVTVVPAFPAGASVPTDPATGEPVEPGTTAHVCRSCGAVLETFREAVDEVVSLLNRRQADAETEANAEWAAANPDAVADVPAHAVTPAEPWAGAERRTGPASRRVTLGGPPDGEHERRRGAWDRRTSTTTTT